MHVLAADGIEAQLNAFLVAHSDDEAQKLLEVLDGMVEILVVVEEDPEGEIKAGFFLDVFGPFHTFGQEIEIFDALFERAIFLNGKRHLGRLVREDQRLVFE